MRKQILPIIAFGTLVGWPMSLPALAQAPEVAPSPENDEIREDGIGLPELLTPPNVEGPATEEDLEGSIFTIENVDRIFVPNGVDDSLIFELPSVPEGVNNENSVEVDDGAIETE